MRSVERRRNARSRRVPGTRRAERGGASEVRGDRSRQRGRAPARRSRMPPSARRSSRRVAHALRCARQAPSRASREPRSRETHPRRYRSSRAATRTREVLGRMQRRGRGAARVRAPSAPVRRGRSPRARGLRGPADVSPRSASRADLRTTPRRARSASRWAPRCAIARSSASVRSTYETTRTSNPSSARTSGVKRRPVPSIPGTRTSVGSVESSGGADMRTQRSSPRALHRDVSDRQRVRVS